MSREDLKAANRRDKKRLVDQGQAHAILVFDGDDPVGWCQYGTKEELSRIDAGRGYKKVGPPKEDSAVWRFTCFYVKKSARGKGVSKFALSEAIDSIRRKGGGIAEAYPVVSKRMAAVPEWRWFGTPNMFRREGFRVVAPLGKSWVLMRKVILPVPISGGGKRES